VAFSPDGRTLATGDFLGGLKLWEVGSGRLTHSLKGHVDSVVALAFTRDGRTLVTGGDDRTVKLWEIGTGRLKETLSGDRKDVNSIVLSPDGELLASGGRDNKVRLWETASWQMQHVLEGDEDPRALAESAEGFSVSTMAFSPGGQLLAVAHGGLVRGEPMQSIDYLTVWDGATWRVKRRLLLGVDQYRIFSIAFAPDSRRLVIGHSRPLGEGAILIWDVVTGEKRTLVPYLEWGPTEVRVVSRDETMVIAGGEFEVAVLDLATGKPRGKLALSRSLTSLAVSPDEKLLAIGDSKGTVTLWNLPLR
jgi:WD40 repeat protein